VGGREAVILETGAVALQEVPRSPHPTGPWEAKDVFQEVPEIESNVNHAEKVMRKEPIDVPENEWENNEVKFFFRTERGPLAVYIQKGTVPILPDEL